MNNEQTKQMSERQRSNERRKEGRLRALAERESTNLLKKLMNTKGVIEKRKLIKEANPLFYAMGNKLIAKPTEYKDE